MEFHNTRYFLSFFPPNNPIVCLADFFNEGDPVQFEAVPQEGNADNPANSYCPWFATLVWKGKRPSVESSLSDSPYSTVTAANSQAAQQVNERTICIIFVKAVQIKNNFDLMCNYSNV